MPSTPYDPERQPTTGQGRDPGSPAEFTPAAEDRSDRPEPTQAFPSTPGGSDQGPQPVPFDTGTHGSGPPPRPGQYDVGPPATATPSGGWSSGGAGTDWSPGGESADSAPADSDSDTDFASVRAREKEAFGGLKLGSAFFGWLTAVGAIVILVGIVAAVAAGTDLREVIDGTTSGQDRIVGIVVLVAVLFVSYYCGGYVAGRMARFNGVRQGIAVWLWSVVIAAAATAAVALTDNDSRVARELDLPSIAFDTNDVTQQSLIALAIVLAVTLIGAIVGGLAGMRFHRRVDRAGFDPEPERQGY